MKPETASLIVSALTCAWLLPLCGFAINAYAGLWTHRLSRAPAWISTGAIAGSLVCSAVAWRAWAASGPLLAGAAEGGGADDRTGLTPLVGTYYLLARFGGLSFGVDYLIDGLTILMFLIVGIVALAVHVYAAGYLADELTEAYIDHDAVGEASHGARHDGLSARSDAVGFEGVERPGRFAEFFAKLSLFCFCMLGVVLAGNLLQVFVFWELVGLTSYLLIGFYRERNRANTAALKAMLMNRVGDVGLLVALGLLVAQFGTLQFFLAPHGADSAAPLGLFEQFGQRELLREANSIDTLTYAPPQNLPVPNSGWNYGILIAAGLGLVAGCVGKSAQVPLQTWLPDAMAGPTPVSALVHSATMVAAGVYLLARVGPVLLPEVLIVVAYLGAATILVGASLALVETDLKRVLAYSTISQLGYMLLAVGVGDTFAAVFHLATHAFFKSLLFLCAGIVLHAAGTGHTLFELGGLRRQLPLTATAMLVGALALAGFAVPLVSFSGEAIAFSGHHSKDEILTAALAFARANPRHFALFVVPLVGAGLTAIYAFRMWYLLFGREPQHPAASEHVPAPVHAASVLMLGPVVVLACFAAGAALGGDKNWIRQLIGTAWVVESEAAIRAGEVFPLNFPGHAEIARAEPLASQLGLCVVLGGGVLAYAVYVRRMLNTVDLRKNLWWFRRALSRAWWFDDLYQVMLVKPVVRLAGVTSRVDSLLIDPVLHGTANLVQWLAKWDTRFDDRVVDGAVNLLGYRARRLGKDLRRFQSGHLRQYVLLLSVSVIVIFAIVFMSLP